jgi:hypothetical protein
MNACEMNTRELSDLELDAVSAAACMVPTKKIDMGIFGTLRIMTVQCDNAPPVTYVRYSPAK